MTIDIEAERLKALDRWTQRYGAQAVDEGWSLFESGRAPGAYDEVLVDGRPYGYRPIELQRDDEAGLLTDDAAAWRHVWRRAHTDHDRCAVEALRILKTFSPGEYAAINRACHRRR